MCWGLNQEVKDICYLNKQVLTENMKLWKRLRKEGIITMSENHNLAIDIDGNKFHILVITKYDKNEDHLDPTLTAWDTFPDEELVGSLFEGYVYYFKREDNRDMVYKYVMGIKD